jgi:sentrin-specific protease 1
VDVFACDGVIVPRNIGNTHWTCLYLDMRAKAAYHVDSLGSAGKDACETLLRWLADEAADKKAGDGWADTSAWRIVGCPPDAPRQENGCDCGAFTCATAFFLAQGRLPTGADVPQAAIPAFRLAMARAIRTQALAVAASPT